MTESNLCDSIRRCRPSQPPSLTRHRPTPRAERQRRPGYSPRP